MNSRRRIAFTKAGLRRIGRDYSRDLPPAEWGSRISLHGSNPKTVMSALGQKQTFKRLRLMSALPPKADIKTDLRNPLAKMQRIFELGFLLMAFRGLVVLAK